MGLGELFAGGINSMAQAERDTRLAAARKAEAARLAALAEPRMEYEGNGWWRIIGAECGEFSRFGREEAEANLRDVIAARSTR